ncbi:MAG: protein kinase [Polyangiaceae bacterium]|nr:protein kinase [Polyangiaceae bacterium]
MGVVYEARHEGLGAAVALKVLHEEHAARPVLAARFLREARIAATLDSAHVARVTDVGELPDGAPFLVMELLRGESLQHLLERLGRVGQDEAIDFTLQILCGLEAAHERGIVHRDLKPDNVFVTPSPGGPLLKLLDFGIAKITAGGEGSGPLTRADALLGTPEYMAPEQRFGAASVDLRADLYSAGAILHELLTGARPGAEGILGPAGQPRLDARPRLHPALPPALVDLVARALAPNPADRFGSARELRLALARHAGALSHAGRLAATPAPWSPEGEPPPAHARTGDPPGAPAHGLVARFPAEGPRSGAPVPGAALAPGEDPAHPGGPTTPPTLLAAAGAPPHAEGGGPASPCGPVTAPGSGAPVEGHPALGTGTAPGVGLARAAPGLVGPAPPGPPPPARRAARLVWLALALAACGAAAAGVWLAFGAGGTGSAEPPLPTVVGGRGGAAGPPPAALPVATAAAPPRPVVTPRGADRPARPVADAGAADASPAFPALPIPLPSALPPLPSALPTALPTTWPPLPGFTPPSPSP